MAYTNESTDGSVLIQVVHNSTIASPDKEKHPELSAVEFEGKGPLMREDTREVSYRSVTPEDLKKFDQECAQGKHGAIFCIGTDEKTGLKTYHARTEQTNDMLSSRTQDGGMIFRDDCTSDLSQLPGTLTDVLDENGEVIPAELKHYNRRIDYVEDSERKHTDNIEHYSVPTHQNNLAASKSVAQLFADNYGGPPVKAPENALKLKSKAQEVKQ